MNELVIGHALRDSVREVLEKMFFVQALEGSSAAELSASVPGAEIAVRLAFEGRPPGSLTLRVNTVAAREIAAGFLGQDEESVSDRQMADVVCELANMICGSLLSRVEGATAFQLEAPRIVPLPEDPGAGPAAISYATNLSRGALAVTVTIGMSPCPDLLPFAS